MKRLSVLVVVCLWMTGCRSNESPQPMIVAVAYKASTVSLRIRNIGASGDIRIQLKNGSKEVQAATEHFQKDEERDVILSLSGVAVGTDMASLDVWLNGFCFATLDLKTNKWVLVGKNG